MELELIRQVRQGRLPLAKAVEQMPHLRTKLVQERKEVISTLIILLIRERDEMK